MPEARLHSGAEGVPLTSASVFAAHSVAPADPSSPPVTTTAFRTAYSPQLDGLRAVAVMMVFLHHAYRIPLLWSGVDLFFILSGYLITNILLRDSGRMSFRKMLGQFYRRRAQRILPAYVLCLVLIAVLVPVNWHLLWPYYTFFLQNVPAAFGLTGFSPLVPLWSLAVEQHFYLIWPFLVYFMPRRWLAPSMIFLLVAIPLLRWVCTPLFALPEPIYVLTPFRIDAMAAGALAALWLPLSRPDRALLSARVSIVLGAITYVLLGSHPWFHRSANTPEFNAIAYSLNIAVLGGFFVWTVLGSETDWLIRILASRPLRALGRVSYSFYLLHLLVLMSLAPHVATRNLPLVAFLVTLGLASLSWRFVEQPIISLGGGHRGASLKPRSA